MEPAPTTTSHILEVALWVAFLGLPLGGLVSYWLGKRRARKAEERAKARSGDPHA